MKGKGTNDLPYDRGELVVHHDIYCLLFAIFASAATAFTHVGTYNTGVIISYRITIPCYDTNRNYLLRSLVQTSILPMFYMFTFYFGLRSSDEGDGSVGADNSPVFHIPTGTRVIIASHY